MQKTTFLASLLLSALTPVAAQEVGFEETFALASDRSAVLAELIPGTPDYYYYNCLQHQHLGQLERVPALMKLWKQRHGQTPRYQEIEYRQALLGYRSDPTGTLGFLRKALNLGFDHQPQIPGRPSPLPTRLDPDLLTLEAWMGRAFSAGGDSLEGVGDPMLESVAGLQLSARQLAQLLGRLQRPDLAGLPALVVRELESRTSRGFGSLNIHKALLQDQLEACLKLRPQLLNERAFISVYLQRLAPGADVRWRDDGPAREAYLDSLWAFASRLAPSNNGLKSHILQHRLLHDLDLGQPSRARLLEFLRLPRRASYVNPEFLSASRQGTSAQPSNTAPTLLGPAGSAEGLVRKYLEHFFQTDEAWDAFSEFVREDYLKRVFAETKILRGVGDMERWYSLIGDSSAYERLEQRVEIEFAPGMRSHYEASQPVTLELDTKNVGSLLVKVFEIDALAYARAEGHEVSASIDLDGLVPGSETTYTYEEPALRRVRRRFDFPGLAQPGVYVIDFIAGGLSSRAVIHKGHLELQERLGSAGHVLGILNSAGELQKDSAVYLGGRRYAADEQGLIVVPYSTSPGWVSLILNSGPLTTVTPFQHRSEEYRLEVGIHVEREAMLAGGSAEILVRAKLLVNGVPAQISLFEDPLLSILATDHHGTQSALDVRDVELFDDREFVHNIPIPAGIVQLRVQLRGQVQSLSRPEKVSLASAWSDFHLNQIDATTEVDGPILGRDAGGYFVDVLGKNGEPVVGKVLRFELQHRAFTQGLSAQLKTDAGGRVRLGELPAIESLQVDGLPTGPGTWRLFEQRRTWPSELHGQQGALLMVPFAGQAAPLTRADVSLLELRNGQFAMDRFSHITRVNGFLELRGLPAGDFDLLLKESGARILVRVTQGEARGAWAMGQARALELQRPALQLLSSEWNGENLELQLAHTSPSTRVHVFVTRFAPAYDAFLDLDSGAPRRPHTRQRLRTASSYSSGRPIGDEYRYILERRFAKKYPGNMLARPSLLLNPWAMLDSNTEMGVGGGTGGRFGGRRGLRAAGRAAESPRVRRPRANGPATFQNLDFLPRGGVTIANLRPDQDGRLVLTSERLGTGAQIRVLVVDRETTIEESLQRTQAELLPRERRLQAGLAPNTHASEQRRIEFLDAGQQTNIEDGVGSAALTYDTLDDVFQLFHTLNPSAELEDFAFLTRWPSLNAEEQRARYSEFACHELNVFLYFKDRAFFEKVVGPLLANKADKTFIDMWLLERDLTAFLEPWSLERLNVFEEILLSQRIDGARAGIRRHIQDQVDLTAVGPEEFDALYRATLAAGGLKEDKDSALAALGYSGQIPTRSAVRGPSSPGAGRKKARGLAIEEEAEEEVDLEELAQSDDFMQNDADLRARIAHLFRALGPTRQFAEHNYYHRRIHDQVAALIGPNAFWLDLAQADSAQGFRSTHFAQATSNVAEMVMALAVLDLPFEAAEHTTTRAGKRVTLEAGSPLILVRKQLVTAQQLAGAGGLLVGQQFFAHRDRYRFDGHERRERLIDDEFLVGTPYGCRVVVTNPSAAPVQLELLLQIPEGSIPINGSDVTRGVPLHLAPYASGQVEYGFYFPAAGEWNHFPAHATRAGEWIACAAPQAMQVVHEPTVQDTTSWKHISQQASQEELMAFLQRENLLRLDLSRIAWRMSERASFDEITDFLRSRHIYHPLLWAYSVQNGDLVTLREFLRHDARLAERSGPWLASPLFDLDPVEQHSYERLEFRPLINARAHPRGGRHEILNQELAEQYASFLNILGHKPELDDGDWMSVTYHFLLQDRIEEALASFARVTRAKLSTKIQYDYMLAYLDFFTDDHSLARSIAERYREHPVPRWRERFEQILAQLDEAQGRPGAADDGSQAGAGNDNLASAEASLEISVSARRVNVRHHNLRIAEVRYYIMDVEFLFSTSPFAQQNAGSVNYVKPNRTDQLMLPVGGAALNFALPEEFRSKNVLVEVRAEGLVERQAHYANSMAVQWRPNYGQLKVTHAESGRPLARVYVKVFAKTAQGVRFHKDGYTDLRGRFDYVSVSGLDGQPIERFSVLVLDKQNGAVIREQAPPTR